MKKSFLLLLSLSVVLASCKTETVEPSQVDEDFVSVPEDAVQGRIRVKLDHELNPGTKSFSVDLSELGAYTIERSFPDAGKFEARHRKAGLTRWYDIAFDKSVPLTKAKNAVRKIDGVDIVEFVEETKNCSVSFTWNDPYFSKQWSFYNDGSKNQTKAGSDVNVLTAWQQTKGDPSVVVAVCDAAVQWTHPDLAPNIWVNEGETPGNGLDDDNNGYVDDVYGYNFVVGTNGVLSPGDHGTHIAGVIAAVNNNGVGICGLAGGESDGNGGTEPGTGNGVRLMSNQTSGGSAYIGNGIAYAADNGAVIMNCSWTISGYSDYVSDAIDYFNEYAGFDEDGNQVGPMAGGVCFFAAGNDATQSAYPAQQDNVFAVASVGADYEKAYYTNFGSWVDISAPGGDANKGYQIYSTVTGSSYADMQGTSMACPHVVGVAALVISKYGGQGFTRDRLIHILQATANKKMFDYNAGYTTRLGAGLVDAGAALNCSTETPDPVTGLSGSAAANTITLNWTVPGPTEVPYQFNLYYSKKSLASMDESKLTSDITKVEINPSSDVKIGDTMSQIVDKLEFGTTYYFRMGSENVLGTRSELPAQITVATVPNSKPEITPLNGTTLNLKSHETGTLEFKIYDADGQELNYSVSGDKGGMMLSRSGDVVTMTFNALQVNSGQDLDYPKDFTATLTVTDSYEPTSLAFNVHVQANNHPKAAEALENVVFNSKTETQTFDLDEYFTDPDGESLKYTTTFYSGVITAKSEVVDKTLKVTGTAYGITEIQVTASDARGTTASQTFKVLVRDGSRPVDLYPNPVKDKLYIRTGSNESGDITITNKAGAVIYKAQNVIIDPFSPATVDMKEQAGGVYYVKVKSASVDATYPIVKQ